MIDRLDIQDTISRYHEGGSTTDWDQVMATFLPDGIWEVPALRVRSEGHAAIRETMVALMAPIEYLVQINAPAIITVDGDAASARSLIRECAKFRGQAGIIDVVGQFNDELQRTPTGWKFAHRTFTIFGTHMSAETTTAVRA
jgi:ketosteroid isomerase-like protein